MRIQANSSTRSISAQSASMLDLDTVICFLEDLPTKQSPKNTYYPALDFLSSKLGA